MFLWAAFSSSSPLKEICRNIYGCYLQWLNCKPFGRSFGENTCVCFPVTRYTSSNMSWTRNIIIGCRNMTFIKQQMKQKDNRIGSCLYPTWLLQIWPDSNRSGLESRSRTSRKRRRKSRWRRRRKRRRNRRKRRRRRQLELDTFLLFILFATAPLSASLGHS